MAHLHCMYSDPESHMNLHSKLPHPHHSVPAPSYQLNPQFQSQHPEPPQYSYPPHTKQPAPIFQVIQHPHGISPTKPKITKIIPAYPTPPAKAQEFNRVPHCTCGTFVPIHGPDRRNWRLRDPRRGFRRRFHRWSQQWERGRSHSEGGEWSRASGPPLVPGVPRGLFYR